MSATDDSIGCALAALLVLAVAAAVLGFAIGADCGAKSGTQAEQKKAIDAGAGRWSIDPATGKAEFEYGPAKKEGKDDE